MALESGKNEGPAQSRLPPGSLNVSKFQRSSCHPFAVFIIEIVLV
jgi:hypothetical protein